jgi:RNA polymerase sigma factor (sigma-70 family)
MGLSEEQRGIMVHAIRTRRFIATSEERFEMVVAQQVGTADSERSEQHEDLRRRLERLNELERSVIILRYGLGGTGPLTLKETGCQLGFAREWVRRIELRALAKLR